MFLVENIKRRESNPNRHLCATRSSSVQIHFFFFIFWHCLVRLEFYDLLLIYIAGNWYRLFSENLAMDIEKSISVWSLHMSCTPLQYSVYIPKLNIQKQKPNRNNFFLSFFFYELDAEFLGHHFYHTPFVRIIRSLKQNWQGDNIESNKLWGCLIVRTWGMGHISMWYV